MPQDPPARQQPNSFVATEATLPQCERIDGLSPLKDLAGKQEEGGSARILVATVEGLGRVAVKCFKSCPPAPDAGPGDAYEIDRAMARREYDLMLRLDGASGHATRAFALGTYVDAQGLPHNALVEELVDGCDGVAYDLETAIAQGYVRYDDREGVLDVALAVAQALRETSRLVVHRDLSPRNVMLAFDRDQRVAKATLIDFSHGARACSTALEDDLLPTLSYGAPEMYRRGSDRLKTLPLVDVFSLGCLLYLMTNPTLDGPAWDTIAEDNAHPYDDEARKRIVAAKQTPLSVNVYSGDELDGKISALMSACTAADPYERPSLEQCVRYLEALRANGPVDGLLDHPNPPTAVLYDDGELAFQRGSATDPDRRVTRLEAQDPYGGWWTSPELAPQVRKVTTLGVSPRTRTGVPRFAGCAHLEDIGGLTSWDVSDADDLTCLFAGCASLADLGPLASWDVSHVRNMNGTFQGCTALVDLGPLQEWDVSSAKRMIQTFRGCSSLEDVSPLKGWRPAPDLTAYATFANTPASGTDELASAWGLPRPPKGRQLS